MNILIAGGAGFIGSHLTDSLLGMGHYVVCADNLCLGREDIICHNYENSYFKFHNIDICNKRKLSDLFKEYNFDRVYHLAANSDIQKGGKNPDIDFHDSFMTTVTLLEAMRENNIRELLFASTSAVYGDKTEILKETAGNLSPVSYYGGAKLASEAFISAYTAMNGFKVNIIRFPNVVGPRLTHGVIFDFVAKLQKNPKELEILGDGNQNKPYVYVFDLIDAILSMSFTEGVEIFNAGVESSTSVRRIADIICEEMGLNQVKYKFTGGASGWLGDVPKFTYDLSKIHAHGWKAEHNSDEAVRLAVKYAVGKIKQKGK